MGKPSKKTIRTVNIKNGGFNKKKKKINKYSYNALREYINFLVAHNPMSKTYYDAVKREKSFKDKVIII